MEWFAVFFGLDGILVRPAARGPVGIYGNGVRHVGVLDQDGHSLPRAG